MTHMLFYGFEAGVSRFTHRLAGLIQPKSGERIPTYSPQPEVLLLVQQLVQSQKMRGGNGNAEKMNLGNTPQRVYSLEVKQIFESHAVAPRCAR